MTLRIIVLVALAFAPLVAASGEGHPIGGVIDLLKKLKGKAIEEGKTEEAAFSKFDYWCRTQISDLTAAIKGEDNTIDQLESDIGGLTETKISLEGDTAKIQALYDDKTLAARHVKEWVKELQGEIPELDDEIKTLQASADRSAKKNAARIKAYNQKSKDLKSTIASVGTALAAMQKASKTDSALLQQGAQDSVRQALALLSVEATDEQRDTLIDFAGAEQAGPGDEAKHVKNYASKSGSVVELLKDLKMKFGDDMTRAVTEETNSANGYALEKQARDAALAASKKSRNQKAATLAETKASLTEARTHKKDSTDDKTADTDSLEKTTTACKTKTREWEERSSTRTREIEALDMAVKILGKVSGVRTKPSNNPGLPASPVDFLQIDDPETKAVKNLLSTAKAVHSKSLERLAMEMFAHKGHFNKLNDAVQKMIFKLMATQTSEDKQKAWCDLELQKTKKTNDEKNDKLKDLTTRINSETAKAAKLQLEITEADEMVSKIMSFMEESTEVRNTGKMENKISIKDAQEAQTATANAIAVLEDFYKSAATPTKPEDIKLPKSPKLWDAGYTGVADPEKASSGVLAILKEVAADFSTMEAKTKAQEVQDQKEYDDQMKAHKVEKNRRQQESNAKVQERKAKLEKNVALTSQAKHTQEEIDALDAYWKELQPTCVSGDSSYADRKAARDKEIKSLRSTQATLKNAFKQKKGAAFLEVDA